MSKTGVTLNEIFGKSGDRVKSREIELADLPALLGDNMPKLEFHALGRIRLQNALAGRFGKGWRGKPGMSGLMAKFDKEAKIEMEHHLIKRKLGRK